MKKRYRVISIQEATGFAVYTVAIIAITFLGRPLGSVTNSWETLFVTYNAWIIEGRYWGVYEVIYNAILFIPLGCILKHRNIRIKTAVVIVFCVTFCIETIQLITGTGLFEICDLIDNTLGGIIGIGLVVLFRKVKLKLIKQKTCGGEP